MAVPSGSRVAVVAVFVTVVGGAVFVGVFVMVRAVHVRPLPACGSGRAGAHDAIMCV